MQRAGQQIRRFANNLTGEIFELLSESDDEVVLLNMTRGEKSINARTLNEPIEVLRKFYTEVATNARYATNEEASAAAERVIERHRKSLEKLSER